MAQHVHNREKTDNDAVLRDVNIESFQFAYVRESEGFIGAQSRRNRVGSLVTHDTGDIHELQAGLAGEPCKRLRERLRGDVGGERRRFKGLG